MSQGITVELDERGIISENQLLFFVETGSKSSPTASLAHNMHWPPVKDLYIRGKDLQDMRGVEINVRFDDRLTPNGKISLNINQPEMSIEGEPTIVPKSG